MKSTIIFQLTLLVFAIFYGKSFRDSVNFSVSHELTYFQSDTQNNEYSDKPNFREIVMLTHLVDSEEAIEKYEYFHSKNGVWPEVVRAAEISGISKIMIYRFERTLVMIITIPAEANLNEISAKYAASSPKLKEWESLMATFQVAPESLKTGEKWAPMKLIHQYENGEVHNP